MKARQGVSSTEVRWSGRAKEQVSRPTEATDKTALDILQSTGLPRFRGVKTAKEEAIGLLRIAAEAEHELMVQYLYAIYSLAPDADPLYGNTVARIAKQEMGHLVTVQNLLSLLGAPPHLDRDTLLPASRFRPIPFVLEPMTTITLAKYSVVEAPLPKDLPVDYPARLVNALQALPPDSQEHINRVGALYTVLYWLFQPSDAPAGKWVINSKDVLTIDAKLGGLHLDNSDFLPPKIIEGLQTNPFEWGGGPEGMIIDTTMNRDAALNALFEISAQGEGQALQLPAIQRSHFGQFLTLFEKATATPLPPSHLPSMPNTQTSPSQIPGVELGRIKNDIARAWATVFNGRYAILLALINFGLRIPKTNAKIDRSIALGWCVDEMLDGISSIARAMVALPPEDPAGGPVAPPFELPKGDWPESSSPNIEAARNELIDQINKSQAAVMELRKQASLSVDVARLFDRLASDDKGRLTVLATKIA